MTADKSDLILSEVKDIKEILTGGTNPEKGLVVKVDRLEQSQGRWTWYIRTALGASIVSVVGLAFKLFVK